MRSKIFQYQTGADYCHMMAMRSSSFETRQLWRSLLESYQYLAELEESSHLLAELKSGSFHPNAPRVKCCQNCRPLFASNTGATTRQGISIQRRNRYVMKGHAQRPKSVTQQRIR
jgi:hypothetical protein